MHSTRSYSSSASPVLGQMHAGTSTLATSAGGSLMSRLPNVREEHSHQYQHTQQPMSLANNGEDQKQTPIIDEETGDELHRHPDLWFEDGSVICRAETTLFRVHMSQLSRHSCFFRDLFSLPKPAGADSTLGYALSMKTSAVDDSGESNCPLICLHDSAEDVANMLRALYDGPTFGDNDRDDFRVVSGILRLSTKYIIDSLREKALAHLCVAWPSTLKAWDTREDLARLHELRTGSNPGTRYPSPIAIINLAREIDAPSLLPSAFYDLSRYHFSQIFEAAEDEPLYCAPSQSNQQNLNCTAISLADTQHLALGKEAGSQAITTLIQAMGQSQHIRQHRKTSSGGPISPCGAVCVSAAACRKDFSELVDLATQHYLFDRERGASDPLYVAEELGQLKSAEFSECVACARSLEGWAARERERMWKLIPFWFRLDLTNTDGASSPRAMTFTP